MDNENNWNWSDGDTRQVSSVYQAEDEANAFILVNPPQDIESQNTEAQNIEIQNIETQIPTAQSTKSIEPIELFEETTLQKLQPQNSELQNTKENTNEKEAPATQSQNTQQQSINTHPNTQQFETQTESQQNTVPSNFHPIVLSQRTYQNYNNNNTQTQAPNHSQRFSAHDISENKVSAIAAYLLGPIGIIIALLIARDSAYTAFHARQALKITICSVILELFAAIFAFFGMIPFVGIIFKMMLVLTCAAWAGTLILRLIAIAQVSNGEAKEPAVICNFAFLK